MNLARDLDRHALVLRGRSALTPEELHEFGIPSRYRSVALVGYGGAAFWRVFSASPEYADGAPDPLDRWSRRIGEELARAHPVTPLFPFDGSPYYPLQRWARCAEALPSSPLGILMHPEYGVWHAWRFALLLESAEDTAPTETAESHCETCAGRPCLKSCPVAPAHRYGAKQHVFHLRAFLDAGES